MKEINDQGKMVQIKISVETMVTPKKEISMIETMITKAKKRGRQKIVGTSGKEHVDLEMNAGTGMQKSV